jgi:hypothetical protein
MRRLKGPGRQAPVGGPFVDAGEHIGLVAELAQPEGGKRCPQAGIVGQDHAGAAHADPLIRCLYELATWGGGRCGMWRGRMLGGIAHIEEVGGPARLARERFGLGAVEPNAAGGPP